MTDLTSVLSSYNSGTSQPGLAQLIQMLMQFQGQGGGAFGAGSNAGGMNGNSFWQQLIQLLQGQGGNGIFGSGSLNAGQFNSGGSPMFTPQQGWQGSAFPNTNYTGQMNQNPQPFSGGIPPSMMGGGTFQVGPGTQSWAQKLGLPAAGLGMY